MDKDGGDRRGRGRQKQKRERGGPPIVISEREEPSDCAIAISEREGDRSDRDDDRKGGREREGERKRALQMRSRRRERSSELKWTGSSKWTGWRSIGSRSKAEKSLTRFVLTLSFIYSSPVSHGVSRFGHACLCRVSAVSLTKKLIKLRGHARCPYVSPACPRVPGVSPYPTPPRLPFWRVHAS